MDNCLCCRDKGLLGGCPKCGQDAQRRAEVASVTEVAESLIIPESYKGVLWNEQIFLKDFISLENNRQFKVYHTKLNRIYDSIANGTLPRGSYMIIAPRRFAKVTWAYACMQQALAHGFTVAPLIDNSQYRYINILCSARYDSRYFKPSKRNPLPYRIDEIDFAELAIMTIDKDNYLGCFPTIDAFIDKRTRLGLTTIIISRFAIPALSYGIWHASEGFIDTERRNNGYKYPEIIEFRLNTQKD